MSVERGDGEGAGSQALSSTLSYINLAEVAVGLVALRGPMHFCACVSEEHTDNAKLAGSYAYGNSFGHKNVVRCSVVQAGE